GRALDMPAGAPLAPRAVPAPPAGGDPLPEREIERIALVLARTDARADPQLVEVALRELAVRGKAADRVVHVAGAARLAGPLHDVGGASLDQPLDERDDL